MNRGQGASPRRVIMTISRCLDWRLEISMPLVCVDCLTLDSQQHEIAASAQQC